MGRCQELNSRLAGSGQFVHRLEYGGHHGPLPARMEMRLDFVEQEDDLASALQSELLGSAEVFTPRPHHHVGQRRDPAHSRGGMYDRYRVGVFRADRRNILGVVDRQAPNLPDCYRLSFDGHGTKDPRHQIRFRPPLSDPARPVIEQALAYSGGAAVDGYRQSGPDLLRRKHVARNPILNVHASSCLPVVPRRIPHRKAAIGVRVDDKPGNPWPSGAPRPAFVQRRVGAFVAATAARRGT